MPMSWRTFSEAFEDLRGRRDRWEAQTQRLAVLAITDDRPRRRWWRRLALLTIAKLVNEHPMAGNRPEELRASEPMRSARPVPRP